MLKNIVKLGYDRNIICYDSTLNRIDKVVKIMREYEHMDVIICPSSIDLPFVNPFSKTPITCYHIPLIFNNRLEEGGDLVRYFLDELKGCLPYGTSCLILGINFLNDKVILGAV